MFPLPHFRGPLKYSARCAELVALSVAKATVRRLRRGPTRKSWNWTVELGTAIIRDQLSAAFRLRKPDEQRALLDAMVLQGPFVHKVTCKEAMADGVRGTWFLPKNPSQNTLLYLHGGGFAFYPKDSYANLIAMMTVTANARTFALDYRLAPEHPYPCALEDVRKAYLWLLDQGTDPKRVVVAGDSAGGNLTLALFCDLRDRGLPLPALGIPLSPATEFDNFRRSLTANQPYDWITGNMALTWRDWYCREGERSLPLVSPIHADLRGLPPIYIQCGRAEILYDSVMAFVEEARRQNANVAVEAWDDMNHVFQFFGEGAPQSAAALSRIKEVVAQHLPTT
jgi:epsilon-lactone hydrolase